ncbi:hypothetical protein B0H10DRAFT_766210 [Mycena sp. CBHHK59/15]|nr:hypothetical protein B0H10DRAFT_766210 [Mycena sp. CBHHK59/15]
MMRGLEESRSKTRFGNRTNKGTSLALVSRLGAVDRPSRPTTYTAGLHPSRVKAAALRRLHRPLLAVPLSLALSLTSVSPANPASARVIIVSKTAPRPHAHASVPESPSSPTHVIRQRPSVNGSSQRHPPSAPQLARNPTVQA